MKKFSDWLEKHLLPIANKVSKQKYLKAVSNTFMTIIPFLTIGSLALVLITPPVDYTTLDPGLLYSFMKGWAALAAVIAVPVGAIYTSCMEFMALFVAAGIGYFLGVKHYKLKGFTPVIMTVVTYLILAGLGVDGSKTFDYFGGTGLFTAIVGSIVSIELLRVLLEKKIGYISLEGQGVPEALTESFAMLIPAFITLAVVSVIYMVVILTTGATLPALIQVILTPILGATNSLWGAVILVFLVMTFWWFGIHDSAITGPMGAFWTVALTANIAAYAAGTATTQLPYIITEPFWWFFIMVGGSGATFGLVMILLFACKSKQLKTVGKLGIIPAFFNINEPIIFGVPIMMNPVMFIPFVGVPVLNCIITYIMMASGIVAKTIAYPGWNLFCPVAALISTVDIKAMILVLFLIILDAAIYFPFIKVLDKEKVKEESLTVGA